MDDVRVVEPDEVDAIRIDGNRDFVTLMTCTPYGVNSHRLLVRGEACELPAEGAPAPFPTGRLAVDRGRCRRGRRSCRGHRRRVPGGPAAKGPSLKRAGAMRAALSRTARLRGGCGSVPKRASALARAPPALERFPM
ncbi:MAG: sortase [Gordonibacter pamelaeae]